MDITEVGEVLQELTSWAASPRIRTINLIGPVDDESVRVVTYALQALSLNDDRLEPITLFINSEGGDENSGWSIYDQIRLAVEVGAQINAIVSGKAASIAALITQACSKVTMHKNSIFLVHNGDVASDEDSPLVSCDEIERQAKAIKISNTRHWQALLDGARKRNPKTTLRQIKALCYKDIDLSPEQARKIGFCDDVI